MSARFPLLNLYRGLLLLIALLIIGGGFFLAMDSADEVVERQYNQYSRQYEDVKEFKPETFAKNFAIPLFLGMTTLVMAELLKLMLYLEYHLNMLRTIAEENRPQKEPILKNKPDEL